MSHSPQAVHAPADQSPRSATLAVTVFPLLIIGGAALGLLAPGTFAPLGAGVTYALMIIMFGMGLTLTLPDFALVLKRPVPVLAGVWAAASRSPAGTSSAEASICCPPGWPLPRLSSAC